MNLKDILDGIAILRPYYDKPDGYHLGAEHDQIYLFATDIELSKSDVAKLIELGWTQEYDGREYDRDFNVYDYRSDESWTAHL